MAVRKYPWEDWFSQPRTVLVRGVDYTISQTMMYQTIRNNASRRRVWVNITETDTGMVIEVVGYMPDGLPHTDQTTITAQHPRGLEEARADEEGAATGN